MKNNVPNWKYFSQLLKKGKKATDFGFNSKDGDVTRFNARYRLAKSFKKIELETYSDNIILGYEGLTRAFLTYSALETYIRLFANEKKISIAKLGINFIDKHQADTVLKKIFKIDNKKQFYAFIKLYANNDIKKSIDDFYNQEDHNIILLLASIRHIFGHGILTPSVNGISPKKVNKICTLLSIFILEQIANDFQKRVPDDS